MRELVVDNRYMEFRLGDQHFAIPLLTVKEVIQKPQITFVPNMPSHFEGMMNLRGQVLGVFSIRKKLNAKPRSQAETESEVIVVIEQDGVSVGMLVDEVTKVLYPDSERLKAAPLKENDPAQAFVTSVIQSDDQLVLTIDVGQLLEIQKYQPSNKVAA